MTSYTPEAIKLMRLLTTQGVPVPQPAPKEDSLLKFLRALKDDALGRFEMFIAKRADNGKDLEISGVASGYGNVDLVGEVIDHGAFAESLVRHKRENTMPLMLFNHYRHEGPVGRWDNFYEDAAGLVAKGTILGGVKRGTDLIAMIEGGAIGSMSVGMRKIVRKNIGGVVHITSADLAEVSIVDWPANPRARIHGQ